MLEDLQKEYLKKSKLDKTIICNEKVVAERLKLLRESGL
jgi:hypothetical protein